LVAGLVERSKELDPDEAIRILFLAGAAVMASVSVYAIWKPKIVFDGFPAERSGHPLNDFQRLLRHGPIYPALAICLFVELRAGVSGTASILPAKHIKSIRCPMG
jgi:hypothetical protein